MIRASAGDQTDRTDQPPPVPRHPHRYQEIGRLLTGLSVVLLVAGLVVGPLWMGSYYEPWRWPLIYLATAAGMILSLTLGKRKKSLGWPSWILAALLILLTAQGGWMWHNCWGKFHQVEGTQAPLRVELLTDVPHPDLPGAVDRAQAWDRLSYIVPCFLLCWGVMRWSRADRRAMPIIFHTLFCVGVVMSLLGLVQRWTEAEAIFWMKKPDDWQFGYFFATFRSPGIASAYLNICLAVGLSLFLRQLRRGVKRRGARSLGSVLGYLFGVVILLNAVMAAGSKAGMAFGVLTLLLTLLLNFRGLRQCYRASASFFPGGSTLERDIIAIAIACIAVLSVLGLAGTSFVRWQGAVESDFGTLTARAEINAVQLEMLQDEKWGALGFGPGSFYPLYPYFAEKDGGSIVVYSHNDFLQTLVEWGWAGFIAFAGVFMGAFVILISALYFGAKHYTTGESMYIKALLIALFILQLHACVDFPFQIESIAITASCLLGLAWSLYRKHSAEIRE